VATGADEVQPRSLIILEPSDVAILLEKLLKVIDQKKDTIRIYHLGGTMPRVERFGKDGPITTKDVMIV
jgi:CRISPR/Cas system-associated endoribonuclease Cas2